MDAKRMGERIRKLRSYEHMTQEQLAEEAGLSVAHVGNVERGVKTPSLAALYSICAALGCKMEYVLAGE